MDSVLSDKILKEIDSLIIKLTDYNAITITRETSELERKAIEISKALKLIRQKSGSKSYELDENAIFVIEDDGIKKYLENLRLNKKLDLSIKSQTDKKLKKEVAFAILLLILGAILGYLPSFFSENKMTKAIESINKTVLDRNKSSNIYDLEIQQLKLKIYSLNTKLDSLEINLNKK